MIPDNYKKEIQGLLNELHPLSGLNHEASESFMAGISYLATIKAADNHDSSMASCEVDSLIHELDKYEHDTEEFLDPSLKLKG
ncbi:hypothetical protein ACI2KR_08990 [Pseudomonas luteola]